MSAFLGRPSAGDSPFAIGDRALRDTSSPTPPTQRNPHPRGYHPNPGPAAGTVNSQGVMMTPSPYGSGSVSDEARRRYEERYAKKRAEDARKAQEEGQQGGQAGQAGQAGQGGQGGQGGQQGGQQGGYQQRPPSQHGPPAQQQQQQQQPQQPQQWGQPPRQATSPQPVHQFHPQQPPHAPGPPPGQAQGQGYGRPPPGPGPQHPHPHQHQQSYGNPSPIPGRASFDAQQQQQQHRGSYSQHSPQPLGQPLHQQFQQMNFADPPQVNSQGHPQGNPQGQHGYGQHYAEHGSQPGSANSSGFRPPQHAQPHSAQGQGHGHGQGHAGQYTTSPPPQHAPSPSLQQQQTYQPQQQQQQQRYQQAPQGSRPGSLQAGQASGSGSSASAHMGRSGSGGGGGGGGGPQWSNNAVPPPSQDWDRGSAHRGSFGSQTQGQPQGQPQSQGQGQYQQQQQQQQAVQPGGMGGEDELKLMFDQFDLTRSGQLSSYDLQRLLAKDSLMEDPREDAVKMLMNIFDTDRSGSINFMEFEGLYRYIQDWHGIFLRFDRDRSGTIDRKELHQALLGFGFSLPGDMVRKLEKRFAPPPKQGGSKGAGARGISFDRFLMACVTVKHFTESFRRYDTSGDGRITVNYDQFMEMVLEAP